MNDIGKKNTVIKSSPLNFAQYAVLPHNIEIVM